MTGRIRPFRIEQGTSTSLIGQVIEESLIEYQAAVARGLPGARFSDGEQVFWVDSGVPFTPYNGVFRTSVNRSEVDRVIEKVKRQFASRNLPFTWQLGPSTRPTNVDQHLLGHGFIHDETEPGMALNLTLMNEQLPAAENIKIRTVRTEIDMDNWIETWACGAPKSFLPIVKTIHGRLKIAENSPWQYFLGMMGNEPLATALLFLGEQSAVVHWIATLPEVRRQGIGTAITLAVLKEARARGYATAILTASDEGAAIYRRIGFREYCKISKFEYPANE